MNLAFSTVRPMARDELRAQVRAVPDFPKPGICFRDITPLLANPAAFGELIDRMAHAVSISEADTLVALESRGFIFASAIAYKLGLPLVLARKAGKLPAETISVPYALEYGEARLEMHRDAISSGSKAAVIDDLLATGGTASAAAALVEHLGGKVACYVFAIELPALAGRAALANAPVTSVLEF